MKCKFNPPVLVPCNIDPTNWKQPFILTEDLSLESDVVNATAPAGFRYDGGSIPRLLWWWIPPFDPRFFRAFTFHDLLYRTQIVDRVIADALLLAIAKHDKAPLLKRWGVYVGVRIGGWRSWRVNSVRMSVATAPPLSGGGSVSLPKT